MRQFVVAEVVEFDGSSWQLPTEEERQETARILAEKAQEVRVLDVSAVPTAYQGFLDPQGHLGSHAPLAA